ncbi:hypothetical protein [Kitasatospora sp. NBC_01539]
MAWKGRWWAISMASWPPKASVSGSWISVNQPVEESLLGEHVQE